MKIYKKMVRPYSQEGSWQGMKSTKTPLADWMDEDLKTASLEMEMRRKCTEVDPMSSLVWESKYEYLASLRIDTGNGFRQMTTEELEEIKGTYVLPVQRNDEKGEIT